jgi:hypothetical protein
MTTQIHVDQIHISHRKDDVDYVFLHTSLPAPFPGLCPTPLVLTFQVPSGTAEKYCRTILGKEADKVVSI